ncbi:MAG: VCBS repeat-containing protein, partial [Acidimicrobiales bacterium]|nr:VCBS repeat-containing protein [Acidimicrobiales bacterium]
GSTRSISVTGAGFRSGGALAVTGGLVAGNVQRSDNRHLTFDLTVPAGMQSGTQSLIWTNADGTTASCLCVDVDASKPEVLFVGPSDKTMTDIYVVLADDKSVNEAGTSIAVFRGAAAVAFTRSVPEPGLVKLHLTNPVDGDFTVKVVARDTAGNVAPLITKTVQRAERITTLNAYGAFTGGAETAAGDVDGDGTAEIITAAGPGGGPHVRIYKVDAIKRTTKELAGFFAYDAAATQGVRVATADIDGDGKVEVVTALGRGGTPEVRVFRIGPTGNVSRIASFNAYGSEVHVGVSVAGGDTNGDGRDEVVTSPGAGAGPHVRAWSIKNGGAQEVLGFMAYNPAFTGGVRATTADLDGDGIAEIVTGAGPGGGPHVQAFSIADGSPQSVASFYAYDAAFTGGVTPSSGDLDGDMYDELIVSAGGGGGPHVKILGFFDDGIYELDGFYAYAANFTGGISAAAGDFDGDFDEDIVTTPGPGMPVQIVARRAI